MGARGAQAACDGGGMPQTGSRPHRKAARAAMTHAPDLDAMSPEEFAAYLDQLDRAEKPQTPEQIWRALTARSNAAANWLYVSQRVRIIDGPDSVEPQYGTYRLIGREGCGGRSEGRRDGKGGGSTCRTRWWPDH